MNPAINEVKYSNDFAAIGTPLKESPKGLQDYANVQ